MWNRIHMVDKSMYAHLTSSHLLTSFQSESFIQFVIETKFVVLRQLLLDWLQRMSTHSDGNTLGLTKHTPPDVAEVNYLLHINPFYIGVLEFDDTNANSYDSSKMYCKFLQFRLAWTSEIIMEWIPSRLRNPTVSCSFESSYLLIDAWDLSLIFTHISSIKCKNVSLTMKVLVFNRNSQVDLREVNLEFNGTSYTSWTVLLVSVKNQTYFPCYVVMTCSPSHLDEISSGEYRSKPYHLAPLCYFHLPCDLSTIVMMKNQVVPCLTWLLYVCWLTDGH